ncbi:MAG: DMT family transporter [Steroidobacteraceae bacterium]
MSQSSGDTAGLLMVAGGAMLFGLKAVLVKLVYAHQVDYDSLVLLRALIATSLFCAWAAWRGALPAIRRAPLVASLAALGAGGLCYGLGSLLDFYALTLIDAGLERALLFAYPAMVVMAAAVMTRRAPERTVVIASLMTWLGVALAVGLFDQGVAKADLVGSACVLLTAATFATYFLVSERQVPRIGPVAFTTLALLGSAIVVCLWYFPTHRSWPVVPTIEGWGLVLALSTVATVLPMLMIAEGIRRVGAVRGALVGTIGPPFTIGVAWLLLDERLSLSQLTGTALIVGGIVVVELVRLRRPLEKA